MPGLQNDIILEDFKIEDAESEIIERKRPIAMVPVAIYKPGKHFSFIGGVGMEYASGKTLGLTRLGVEYGFHIPNNWEVGVAVVWDSKWRYYNTWGMAFTFSKIWPRGRGRFPLFIGSCFSELSSPPWRAAISCFSPLIEWTGCHASIGGIFIFNT